MCTSFPIKIDLTEFFTDQRKQVMILVDPKWATVSVLKQKVASAFFMATPPNFMSIDGYYIPDWESIEVMRNLEELKGFTSFQDPKDTTVNSKLSVPESSQNKRKYSAVSDDQQPAASEPTSNKKKCSNTSKTRRDSNERPNNSNNQQVEETTSESVVTSKKKKKRKETTKSQPPSETDGQPTLDANGNPTNAEVQHIYFNEDDDDEPSSSQVRFSCPLTEADPEEPRVFRPQRKPAIEIQAVEVIKAADPLQVTSDCAVAIHNSTVINTNDADVAAEQPSAFEGDAEMANSTAICAEIPVQSMMVATPNNSNELATTEETPTAEGHTGKEDRDGASCSTQEQESPENEEVQSNKVRFSCSLAKMNDQKPRVFRPKAKPVVVIQKVEIFREPDPPQATSDFYSMNSTETNTCDSNVDVEAQQLSMFQCIAEIANSTGICDEMPVQSMMDAPLNLSNGHELPVSSMEELESLEYDSQLIGTTAESTDVIDVDEDNDENGDANTTHTIDEEDEEEVIELNETEEPACESN